MLTPYSQSKFVQKILTSESGEQFRVLFYVTLVNGELKGQVISATPIEQDSTKTFNDSRPVAFLAAPITIRDTVTEYAPAFAPVISPFSSIEFLINSQPTRAPSRI